MTQTLDIGRQQTVGPLRPSDFVGRPGQDEAVFGLTVITGLVLRWFRKKPLQTMMQAPSHVAYRVVEMTLCVLTRARKHLTCP